MAAAFRPCDDPDVLLTAEQVRARFTWAKRQGRPAWLWPDIAIADWRGALQSIERIVAARLADRPGETLTGPPGAIGLACYTSGVGPLLGWWLARGEIAATPDIAVRLEAHLGHNCRRIDRMTRATRAIVERWQRQGIDAVILKGLHTAHSYFPNPATRPASDVDLLVPAAALAAAERDLTRSGHALQGRGRWESCWCYPDTAAHPQTLRSVHADDPWTIDLHGALCVEPAGGPVARLDRENAFGGGAVRPFGAAATGLPQPLLLLHLAAHAGAGLHNLTLLRQIELILVIRQDRPDWPDFVEVAQRTHALAYVFPALALCERLAPGHVPAAVLDRCRDAAPPAVRRIVAGLTPATAQRVDRNSITEHFMWTQDWRGLLGQIGGDLAGGKRLLSIYERRAWTLLRGTFAR